MFVTKPSFESAHSDLTFGVGAFVSANRRFWSPAACKNMGLGEIVTYTPKPRIGFRDAFEVQVKWLSSGRTHTYVEPHLSLSLTEPNVSYYEQSYSIE